MIGNITNTEDKTQGFLLAPPLKPRKKKLPENTFLSFIDEIQNGLYGGCKLVRASPQKTTDVHFTLKTMTTSVRSYRRNYSHKGVALFKTKRGGPTRSNIEYMTCSFLELDGSTDGTIKSLEDVLTLIKNNNLPKPSYLIETSPGHFHLIWNYNNPLPWNERNESYWLSQQKRLIQLFQKSGFNADIGASLNPCQNLRNPSQLQPYNYKRRCEVVIHTSYQKTSLRAIFRALNGTSIANPAPIRAGVKLRRYLRANQTFTMTHKELAITLGTSHSTAERIVKRAIANGDMFAVGKVGNNKGITRATRYRSGLYLEPQFSEPSHSSIKINSYKKTDLLAYFQANGAEKGRRNRTLFALGLEIKSQLGNRASIEAIRAELGGGAMRCLVSEKEFERTLKNIMKPAYSHPLSLAKMRQWDLIEGTKHFH